MKYRVILSLFSVLEKRTQFRSSSGFVDIFVARLVTMFIVVVVVVVIIIVLVITIVLVIVVVVVVVIVA